MTELQQSKYQELQAGLPSELSMQLAEVALALGSAEDQVMASFSSLSFLFLVSTVFPPASVNKSPTFGLCGVFLFMVILHQL